MRYFVSEERSQRAKRRRKDVETTSWQDVEKTLFFIINVNRKDVLAKTSKRRHGKDVEKTSWQRRRTDVLAKTSIRRLGKDVEKTSWQRRQKDVLEQRRKDVEIMSFQGIEKTLIFGHKR